ncbi:hypothetical protein ACTFIW_013324 [Dictyostelium discoideum]
MKNAHLKYFKLALMVLFKRNFLKLDFVTPRKLAGLKGKLTDLNESDTLKMFAKIETERSNAKKSVNSSGNKTTGNSGNSKFSSGSNGRSNNFNGSPSNVASEEQEVNLPLGGRLFHRKQVWKESGLPNFGQEVVNGLKVHLLPKFKPMPNPIPISIAGGPKSDCITKEAQNLLLDDVIGYQVADLQIGKISIKETFFELDEFIFSKIEGK